MITSPSFSYPFFLGLESAEPVVGGGPTETGGVTTCVPNTITLDGRTFPVDMTEWRSGPQDTFRDTLVANDEPNDSLFNARGAWARYRYSWHHGAGQALGDLDALADPFRFLSSYDLAWTTKYQMTLAHSTTLERTDASAIQLLQRSGDYVFLGAGTKLYRTTDLITWTAMTDPGGTIQAMTTDGTDLYVATSTVMVKYVGTGTSGTAFGTAVTGNCTNVSFCSGRLLMAKANVLYEVAAAGTLTTISTHFQAAFRWTSIFNIGSRMYIGGFAGARTELYTVTTDSTGALVRSQEAAPFPVGELLRTALAVAGSVILCTSNGARVAEVSGDGTLTYGPLIDEPGDVQCATADGRYAFIGWSAIESSRSGVGRLVLDDEVFPLQPAFGTDISEGTTQAAVTGVARLSGKTAFAVAGSGVWVGSSSAYAQRGQVQSGRISFGTVEPKAMIGLSLVHAPLLADESIDVAIFDENGVNIGAGTSDVLASTNFEVDLGGVQVPYITVRVTLNGPGTTTPTLQHWRARGYPVPPAVLQWVLPMIAHEQVIVNSSEGEEMSMDLDGIHTWIEELWGTRRYTLLRIGTREYRVRVDNFEWRPRKWTDDGAVPQGLLVVQLVDA